MNQHTTITLFFLSLIICLSIACNTSSEKTTNETTNSKESTETPASATTTTQETAETPKPADNSAAVPVDAAVNTTTTTNTETATPVPAASTTKATENSPVTTTKAATEKTEEAPKAAAGTIEGDAQKLAELLCKSQKLVEDALTAGDGMDAKLNEANQMKGQYEELKKVCQKNHSNWGNFLKALKGAVDVCGGQLEGF